MFKLPTLTTEIDCEPIGYPGLVVTCRLNPPIMDWQAPAKPAGEWDELVYHSWARILQSVSVPAELTDNGEAEIIPIAEAKDVYDLERRPDWDPQILLWAMGQYSRQRSKRLEAEQKN